jgi:hypothetical protein
MMVWGECHAAEWQVICRISEVDLHRNMTCMFYGSVFLFQSFDVAKLRFIKVFMIYQLWVRTVHYPPIEWQLQLEDPIPGYILSQATNVRRRLERLRLG